MNVSVHDVLMDGHGTYRFETVECPHCKDCRTIDSDHATRFCPSCGKAFGADVANVVEHDAWALYCLRLKTMDDASLE